MKSTQIGTYRGSRNILNPGGLVFKDYCFPKVVVRTFFFFFGNLIQYNFLLICSGTSYSQF